jgi:hypothetical protein
MTRRHRLILMTILAVLTLQFGVPAVQYFSEGANRWGWQMYSREQSLPAVLVVSPEGERTSADLPDHLFLLRSELRIDERAARQLCERYPRAVAIEVVDRTTGEATPHQCYD